MAIGIAELISRPVPDVTVDPADLKAGALQRGDATLQRLRAAGAERGMSEARGLCPRQLQGVALIVVPAAQIDGVPLGATDGHAEHVDKERQALVWHGREDFE